MPIALPVRLLQTFFPSRSFGLLIPASLRVKTKVDTDFRFENHGATRKAVRLHGSPGPRNENEMA